MIVDKYAKNGNVEKIKNIRMQRALHHLFTDKQLRILEKLLNFEKLTKSENEYYSRIIKPRVNAIIDIQDLALMLRNKL